jgi:hypothetical protein
LPTSARRCGASHSNGYDESSSMDTPLRSNLNVPNAPSQ